MISWQHICLPVDDGDLGIRRFLSTLRAFNFKLWWSYEAHHSLWAQYMHSKYDCGYFSDPISIAVHDKLTEFRNGLSMLVLRLSSTLDGP